MWPCVGAKFGCWTFGAKTGGGTLGAKDGPGGLASIPKDGCGGGVLEKSLFKFILVVAISDCILDWFYISKDLFLALDL